MISASSGLRPGALHDANGRDAQGGGRLRKLLYIASVGYSGSTLLDMLLGRSDEITSLGEIHSLAKAARRDSRCTCGEPISSCPFWSGVERALAVALRQTDLRLSEFNLAPDDREQSLHRLVPNLADLLLVLGSRGVWERFASLSRHARGYAESAENALALYRVVAGLKGTPIVVDSSKDPLPMKALYLADPQVVRIIYLVRDGRAVSRSLVRRQDLGFEEAVRRWVRFNWNLHLVMKTIPRSRVLLVRYEDLCRDTAAELKRLADFAGTSLATAATPLRKDRFHNIGGNPMRFRRSETEIVLDERWREELSREQRGAFESIGGRLNRRLGYT